ncbi:hypothetical protein ANN_19035 [Periplaneta americana]|uniref:Uncharacterized protein n=1 Tax=Periplaneta americana TaxID=6978 RepID=A0ABQ8SQY1_PERAM|nr:hypothetical protein ANN_19035 [Periplaneta americana]
MMIETEGPMAGLCQIQEELRVSILGSGGVYLEKPEVLLCSLDDDHDANDDDKDYDGDRTVLPELCSQCLGSLQQYTDSTQFFEQVVSEVVLQTFRDDGEGHMYQFEIRNPGPEMTESKVKAKIVPWK